MAERKSARRATNAAGAESIDDYLAVLDEDKRAALEKLRADILAAAPGAEECISYQMPAFRFRGRMLVWFGATPNHCAFYPGGVVQGFEKELAGYETSKGTVRFQPSKPLPARLVTKLVKARIAANEGRAARTKRGPARAVRRRVRPR